MIAVLALIFGLLNPVAQESGMDFELARREYIDLARSLIEKDAPTEEELGKAQTAITELVKTGMARALVMIASDAQDAAERLLTLTVELEEGKVLLERRKTSLADLTGGDRELKEAEILELEKRIALLELLVPQLRVLRTALYEGLLEVTEKAADVDPEAAFAALVAYFKEDSRGFYDLDLKVRQLDASLASVKESLLGERDEKKKSALEQREARLATALELRRSDLSRLGSLRGRRIQVLASLYSRLPEAVQTRELKSIRQNLRDDVAWESRAVHAELLGNLPVDAAVPDIIKVLKRAAKQRRDADKQLETLRVTYDRALAALMTASLGGGGMVPSATMANKNKAEKELRLVSQQEFGESAVMESAARALGVALASMKGESRDDRLDKVLKLAARDADRDVRVRALGALGALQDERVRSALQKDLLEGSDLRVRLAALDALIQQGHESLVECCITRLLRDTEWRIRAAAMRALVAIPRKQAVPALIQSVAAEVGRLVDDAEQALFALTGRSFNGDAFLWKDWWSKNKDSFVIGEVAAATGGKKETSSEWKNAPGHVSFYGITTRSNRILFVLDRSGSMNEPIGSADTGAETRRKIDAAKQQLKSAIASLEEGDLFNIITYAVDVTPWQRKMVKMTPKVARKVERYIDHEIDAASGTNIHDALRDAFRVAGIGAMDKAYESNVDTIFFLTDGRPSVGEVQQPEEILLRVKEWNRLARIVVHAVGVGKDHDASFLRRLAEENGGQYTSR